jgi:hypothetical protein
VNLNDILSNSAKRLDHHLSGEVQANAILTYLNPASTIYLLSDSAFMEAIETCQKSLLELMT